MAEPYTFVPGEDCQRVVKALTHSVTRQYPRSQICQKQVTCCTATYVARLSVSSLQVENVFSVHYFVPSSLILGVLVGNSSKLAKQTHPSSYLSDPKWLIRTSLAVLTV